MEVEEAPATGQEAGPQAATAAPQADAGMADAPVTQEIPAPQPPPKRRTEPLKSQQPADPHGIKDATEAPAGEPSAPDAGVAAAATMEAGEGHSGDDTPAHQQAPDAGDGAADAADISGQNDPSDARAEQHAAEQQLKMTRSSGAPSAAASLRQRVPRQSEPEPEQAKHQEYEEQGALQSELPAEQQHNTLEAEGHHEAPVTSTTKHEPSKESAVDRLTEPTAMGMLKSLEKTQGGKTEWHIASGVTMKSKRLSPDELSSMVDRLCTTKNAASELGKPHAIRLVYEGTKETYVPVKEVTKQENIAYMAVLYERCQETRKKTKETLAAKYLQPLTKPTSPPAAGRLPAGGGAKKGKKGTMAAGEAAAGEGQGVAASG